MPATKGGGIWSFSAGPGIGVQGALTQVTDTSDISGTSAIATTGLNPSSNGGVNSGQPNLAYWLVGVIVFLVALKWLSEHDKAGMDPKHVAVNVWNFLIITLLAIVGIDGFKAIVTKYPNIPSGISQLVTAA